MADLGKQHVDAVLVDGFALQGGLRPGPVFPSDKIQFVIPGHSQLRYFVRIKIRHYRFRYFFLRFKILTPDPEISARTNQAQDGQNHYLYFLLFHYLFFLLIQMMIPAASSPTGITPISRTPSRRAEAAGTVT